MNEVPTVEESMAKIGAPAWTSHGYSCRRERELLAELVQAEVNHSKESPGRPEFHGCGTWLLYAAHDRFIKEVLAEEIARYEKVAKSSDQNSSRMLFVEFLKRSLNDTILFDHPALLVHQNYMNTKFHEMEKAQSELKRITERLEGMKRIGPDGFIFTQSLIEKLEQKAEQQRQILSWL